MKVLIAGLIPILFIANLVSSSSKAEKTIIAINCGGDAYEDADGVIYESDNYYNKGTPSDYGLQYDIELTKDEELYQTERWADGDLIYTLPFDTDPGTYVAILKFSEVYFSQAGEKVFDVALGSKVLVNNLDIFEQVGKAKAHDEFIEFELRNDDIIYVKGQPIKDAYDSDYKTLTITFKKGLKDNPKVNAIVVFKGDIMGKKS